MRFGWAPSRRAATELIAHGRVRVNGRRYRKGEVVAPGDRVEVVAGDCAEAADGPAPNPDLAIAVLYEDAAMIVVDKPALMPCHPLRPAERTTVMNAIAAAYPETARGFDRPLEGGLVHRLDNGTSGALMIARNREALAVLREALRAGRITRRYRALVAARLDGTIEIATAIAHHAKNPRKMVTVAPAAGVVDDRAGAESSNVAVSLRHRSVPRAALTIVSAVAHEAGYTLVEVTPRSGSRHQIRVHLASIGNPLAGDELYGGAPLEGLAAGRFWLHLAEPGIRIAGGRPGDGDGAAGPRPRGVDRRAARAPARTAGRRLAAQPWPSI